MTGEAQRQCTSVASFSGAGVQCDATLGHDGPHRAVFGARYTNADTWDPLRGDTKVGMTWVAPVGSLTSEAAPTGPAPR